MADIQLVSVTAGLVLAGFVALPIAPLVFFEWRRGKFRYRGSGLGPRNAVTGLLGAILVALVMQVTTPPNLRLTSKPDPNSLTGKLDWSGRFELIVLSLGFLFGLALGNLGKRERTVDSAPNPDMQATRPAVPAGSPATNCTPAVRQCPHCEAPMARDTSTCPHCQGTSSAWTLHQGAWWVQATGGWYWLDEARGAWNLWGAAAASPPTG